MSPLHLMGLATWNVAAALFAIFVVTRVQKLLSGIRATGNIPGFRIPFQPLALPGAVIKTSWWNPGLEAVWKWKQFLYERTSNDTISVVPFVIGRPAVYTANLEVAKQILAGSNKSAFVKMDVSKQGPLGYWGTNLFHSDGELWKKHRRIVGPAFSQNLYELVWSESLDLYKEMLSAEGFEDKKTVELSAQHITFKFAFYIIGRCGFDFPFRWGESMDPVDGSIPFADAMRYFIDNIDLLNLPQSVLNLPTSKFKKLNECISEIRKFMDSKIIEKETELKSKQELGNDIFSMLVRANQSEEDSKLKLSYAELISDIFLMLFAGHETTAHVLAATLACLAKFPDKQQEVVDHIMSVIGADRDPTLDDYYKLNKVQAAFYEALRMFPTAFVTIREAKEDTFLNIPNSRNGDEYTTVPILKDTQMVVDMVGIHRNPQYFENPEEYNPSRWYNVANESQEALPGFGFGPRACIGRKFAVSEAVCFLTMVLRDWRIEPLLNKGESTEEWFRKLSEGKILVTLGASEVPIRLVRRF